MMRKFHKAFLTLGLVCYSFCVLGSGPLFEKVSPSVVEINNGILYGSGIVLNSSGLILTNYHLVASQLPLKIIAVVKDKSGIREKLFQNAKVYRVHKRENLAIIQLKLPRNNRLISANMSKKRLTIENSSCAYLRYVHAVDEKSILFGDVLGEEEEPNQAEIKVYSTTIDGEIQDYGGALVSEEGNVVGISTLSLTKSNEFISRFIPSTEIKKENFVDPRERKLNKVHAREFFQEGFSNLSKLIQESDEQQLQDAFAQISFSFILNPNDHENYQKLADIFFKLKRYEEAKYFYSYSVPINEAQSADNLFMLGLCQSYLGDEKDARKYWTKALTVEQPNKKSAAAGIQLSERYLKDGDEVSAIYLIYWAQHILGYSVLDIPKVQNIYNQSVDEITEKQFQYLYAKQGNYSLDNLSLFKSNKFQNLEGEIKKQKVDLAKRSNVVDQKLFAPFLNKAPQPTNNGMLRQYPERAWDVKPAYAGAYLIFKFPNMKKLGVFNIAQFRFEKYITLKSSHAIYATGGKILIVYEPDKREFILYNLSTFEVINTYKYRKTKEILSLDMGLLSGKRALVSIQETNKQYDRSYAFLELPSMDFQPLNFISSERALTDSGYSRIKKVKLQLRVSPRLHSIISWGTSETHSEGYGYSTIKGNKILSYFTRGEEFGALNFLDNTEEILSTNGDVLSPNGLVKRTIGDPTQVSFSVWGANLVVQAEKHKVKLMDAISKEVYNTYKIPFELTSQFNNLAHFTLEKSVFASAYLNRIIFIDNINNRIVSFKLLDESKLGLIRDQHIVVMPGDLWRKRMRYPAGTQIDIEDSPEGVTFDPTLLELNWDVPRRMSKGKYQILLYIKEPTKEPHYRRLTITVQ